MEGLVPIDAKYWIEHVPIAIAKYGTVRATPCWRGYWERAAILVSITVPW